MIVCLELDVAMVGLPSCDLLGRNHGKEREEQCEQSGRREEACRVTPGQSRCYSELHSQISIVVRVAACQCAW